MIDLLRWLDRGLCRDPIARTHNYKRGQALEVQKYRPCD